MTGRLGLTRADHDRAAGLAALRLDEPLSTTDAAWLDVHLGACEACAVVAAEYDEQRVAFRALRGLAPEPPRDLWARTSAAIEAERARPSGLAAFRRAFAMPRASRRLSLAPLAAAVIVVVVVGAGLLNGGLTAPGGAPAPTPIALAAAAVQVLARDSAGNVQILTRPVDAVCPVGASACGVSPTFAVTSVNGFSASSELNGTLSPSQDRMVVVAGSAGSGGGGVYIVPVANVAVAATPAPVVTSPPASPPASATASSTPPSAPTSAAPPSVPPSSAARPTATPSASASPSPATPSASATPAASAPAPSAAPSASSEPPVGSTPPAASASPSSPASSSVMPSAPSAPATAAAASAASASAPDTAIRIASGVTVVGAPLYAPDGVHLAFSAMPSDGSTGPDVYVWAPGEKAAQPITTDHGSWLAGWTADGILVSRVANGNPSTYLLDPLHGRAMPIGADMTWLPVASPSGTTAAWWNGTVKLAADGVTWVPDAGRLVLGAWPNSAEAPAPQVVAKGPLTDWQVRWDESGSVAAVWLDGAGSGHSGTLSLYRLDPATGLADLANPLLDAAPAAPGFSLRSGRLAWTAPVVGNPQVVEVLAWAGTTVGRLELPADGSGTVVP